MPYGPVVVMSNVWRMSRIIILFEPESGRIVPLPKERKGLKTQRRYLSSLRFESVFLVDLDNVFWIVFMVRACMLSDI